MASAWIIAATAVLATSTYTPLWNAEHGIVTAVAFHANGTDGPTQALARMTVGRHAIIVSAEKR